MSEENPLLGLRDKIDALDLQIMQSISDRARCAQQVAEVKKGQGDEAYYKPEREAQPHQTTPRWHQENHQPLLSC